MGKRKKEGVHPADAERKKEADRRKKANAESRRTNREAALAKASAADLREDIAKITRAEKAGLADQHALDRKKRLEKEVIEARLREQRKAAAPAAAEEAQVTIKGLGRIFKKDGAQLAIKDASGSDSDDDDEEETGDSSVDPYQARLKRLEAARGQGAYTYDDSYRSSLPRALLAGAGSKEKLKRIQRGEELDPVLAAAQAKAKGEDKEEDEAVPSKDELPPPPDLPPGLDAPSNGYEIPEYAFGRGLLEIRKPEPAPMPPAVDLAAARPAPMPQQQPHGGYYAPQPMMMAYPPQPQYGYPQYGAPQHMHMPPPPPPRNIPAAGVGPQHHPDRAMPPRDAQGPHAGPGAALGTGWGGPPAAGGGGGHAQGGARREFLPRGGGHQHREKFELDPMDPNPESAEEAWLEEQQGGGGRKRFKGPGGARQPPPITEAPTGPTVAPRPAAAAATPAEDGRPKQATIKPSFTPTSLLVRNRPAAAAAPVARPRSVQINAAPDVAGDAAPQPPPRAHAPPPPPSRAPPSAAAAYNDFIAGLGNL